MNCRGKKVKKMKYKSTSVLNIILPIFLIITFIVPDKLLKAQQTECSKILDKAQNLYLEGKFDESVNLIQSCTASKQLTKAEKRQVYKIMSQIELARGDQDKAKENIRLLLQIDPDFQPTIEQETPTYVQLVESVRQEIITEKNNVVVKQESRTRSISKWWYYSAGVVVVGTAYILFNGDDKKKDKPLDTPPPWKE
jgi:hypothetical protein